MGTKINGNKYRMNNKYQSVADNSYTRREHIS